MTAPPDAARIDRIDVVVPVHDEEDLLPRCLAALVAAATACPLPVRLVLALDRCSDASLERISDAASAPAGVGIEFETLHLDAGSVGAARAAGVARALDRAHPLDPARHWLCTTDADTEVPADWLLVHLAAARAGAGLTLGRVRPRAGELPAPVLHTWQSAYAAEAGPIHGANLGVRADHYLAAGGFPPLTAHEDVALVHAMRARGVDATLLPASVVTTSARLLGRAPSGFAAHLRGLAAG